MFNFLKKKLKVFEKNLEAEIEAELKKEDKIEKRQLEQETVSKPPEMKPPAQPQEAPPVQPLAKEEEKPVVTRKRALRAQKPVSEEKKERERQLDRQIEEILEQIERSDPHDLEKEVYEEFTLIVCKSCRDRFVDEAQHPWEGPFQIKKGPDRMMH